MKQLHGVDVAFLMMETPTTYGHVSSLSLYDPASAPGGAGFEATRQMLLERLHLLPPFRQRLVEVPLELDRPYWVDDPDFDIDFHVRHHGVPAPGTPEQVAEAVSRIVARPLDRTRPLWELYVIEGIDGGRLIGQLTKIHHAAVDGAAGAMMLSTMLDTDPAARPTQHVEPWAPGKIPADHEMLGRALVELARSPEKAIRATVRIARQVARSTNSQVLQSIAEALAEPLPGPLGRELRRRLASTARTDDTPPVLPFASAPKTPFNAPISPHRRFAYTSVELDDAKRIRRALGCTFNDVVMALCAGTLRRYLDSHDALPEQPLVAMVPVSVRTGDEDDPYTNRVSALLCELATDEADPLRRLHRIRASMDSGKASFDPVSAAILQDVTQFAPPAIGARIARMVSRMRIADRVNPPFNVVISNVPGPQHPLYAAGAELCHYYPVSTIVDGVGLNMTVQSYNGHLDFGFVACRELVPDLWAMTDMLHAELHDLLAAVTPPAPVKKKPTTKAPARKAPVKKVTTAGGRARRATASRTARR